MVRLGIGWLVGVAIVAGCGGDPETELLVDLRSDFAPGTEVARV